ncbi:conjugal transfer protein [Streptomyces sp. H27-C3]|uniref:conjugal transfer protein n=1 Tax=Streptomyces sp. H27-C3 TaxID=3046305 RepID=UPI0024BBC2B0|nr:conjugal transfer protein [Streptomyces sp. H27-C3]
MGQAGVPTLPPRRSQKSGSGKKEQRERAKAARKAEYERKKAAREQKKSGSAGGGRPAAAGAAAGGELSSGRAPQARPQASPGSGTAGQQPRPVSAAGKGVPFDVPKAGGRIPASGRRTHIGLRATVLVSTCLLALGSCGVMGMVVGKSGKQVAELSTKDVRRYRLTDFPTAEAGTFAERYAVQCLTYSPETVDERRDALAEFASSGVDPDCGWSGTGKQKVVSVTWDGTVEPLREFGAHGRYMGVQARLDSGVVTVLSIPVYVKDLETGQGLRIVGNVGEMPLPTEGKAPVLGDEAEIDDELSTQLQEKVFPGFFEAWGESDATAMTRFTTPDASTSATSGLAGALEKPQITTVEAVAPVGAKDGNTYTYRTDQPVQARVEVAWTDAHGAKLSRSYRVTVVNTEQGWFIKDIRGGVLDPEGGSADADIPAPGGADQGTLEPTEDPTETSDPAGSSTPPGSKNDAPRKKDGPRNKGDKKS